MARTIQGRPHNTIIKPSATRTTQIGISIPVDLLLAVDRWAEPAGYMRADGSTNRSGAIRAILMMALSDEGILAAAIRAKRMALVGGVSERLRQLYMQVHKMMMDEVSSLDDE